jgi:hypothetical protein
VKKPVTVYTRNSFASETSYNAAEGFDVNGTKLGRSAYVVRDLDQALLRKPGAYLITAVGTESDAIRWVALGVLPDEEG